MPSPRRRQPSPLLPVVLTYQVVPDACGAGRIRRMRTHSRREEHRNQDCRPREGAPPPLAPRRWRCSRGELVRTTSVIGSRDWPWLDLYQMHCKYHLDGGVRMRALLHARTDIRGLFLPFRYGLRDGDGGAAPYPIERNRKAKPDPAVGQRWNTSQNVRKYISSLLSCYSRGEKS